MEDVKAFDAFVFERFVILIGGVIVGALCTAAVFAACWLHANMKKHWPPCVPSESEKMYRDFLLEKAMIEREREHLKHCRSCKPRSILFPCELRVLEDIGFVDPSGTIV